MSIVVNKTRLPVTQWQTESGSVVSISDARKRYAKSLSVALEPIQSGSGDPSPNNIRPISGTSSVTAVRAGKNLLNDSLRYVANATTVYLGSDDNSYATYLRAGTYTISAVYSEGHHYSMYYREQSDTSNRTAWTAGQTSVNSSIITLEKDGYWRFWAYRNTSQGSVDSAKIISVQLELGSATAYEPYQGISVTLSLGHTVYGGTVDLVSGVMKVTDKMTVFDGSENDWTLVASGRVLTLSEAAVFDVPLAESVKCNAYIKSVNRGSTSSIYNNNPDCSFCTRTDYDRRLYIKDSRFIDDLDGFKTWISQNNLQFCQPLATPQIIQLTAHQIEMLMRHNTVWSDAGLVTLEYARIRQ